MSSSLSHITVVALPGEVYCIIIIINNTNLINCYRFQFSICYQTWFLGNKMSVLCTRAQRYTRWMKQCYEPHAILCSEQSRANRKIRADTCDQMSSMSRHKNVEICRSTHPIALIFFLSYTEEFYLITIAMFF